MKKIRNFLLLIIVFLVLLVVGIKVLLTENVDTDELPQTVYNEQTNLLGTVNLELLEFFTSSLFGEDEYTPVENILNYIIRDSIDKNVNEEYDPLGECETDECIYIVSEDYYYVNFIWAELTEDDQIIINVSGGTNVLGNTNTIAHFYFDLDVDFSSFEIVLTLDHIELNELVLTTETIEKIIDKLDKDAIEESVSKGTLDLDEFTYTLGFSIFD